MLHILTPFILNSGAKVYNKSAVLKSVEGFRDFFLLVWMSKPIANTNTDTSNFLRFFLLQP